MLLVATIAHCLSPISARAADTTPILALYNIPVGRYAFAKKLGLNSVVIWPEKNQLDEARSLGLRAIVNVFPGNYPDTATWKNKIRKFKNHPAVFAWCLYDEPDMNKKPVSLVAWAYKTLKSMDTTHPVYQTLWNPNRYADYAPYCDIIAVVPYIVTKLDPLTQDDYARVYQFIAWAKRLAPGKPVYAVIQSFGGHPVWPRAPTAPEVLNMVSIAKSAGADGYAFYAYTSNEPYPFPNSFGKFQLTTETPLMEAIKKSVNDVLK